MPTSKLTRVRSDGFSKIIASVLPSSAVGELLRVGLDVGGEVEQVADLRRGEVAKREEVGGEHTGSRNSAAQGARHRNYTPAARKASSFQGFMQKRADSMQRRCARVPSGARRGASVTRPRDSRPWLLRERAARAAASAPPAAAGLGDLRAASRTRSSPRSVARHRSTSAGDSPCTSSHVSASPNAPRDISARAARGEMFGSRSRRCSARTWYRRSTSRRATGRMPSQLRPASRAGCPRSSEKPSGTSRLPSEDRVGQRLGHGVETRRGYASTSASDCHSASCDAGLLQFRRDRLEQPQPCERAEDAL